MDSNKILLELDSKSEIKSASPITIKKTGKRGSKLDPYRQEILSRRSQGKKLRQICNWLLYAKGQSVHHSTVSDFIDKCLEE